MISFTSVTFRQKSLEEIFDTAVRFSIPVIEAGCDVHIPDEKAAERAAALSKKTGVRISSLGSYFHAGDDAAEDFDTLLSMAQITGTKNIRIWAGGRSSAEAAQDYFINSANQASLAAQKAGKTGITVSLEFHQNTLNDSASASLKYLQAANCENLKTYWQPLFGGADDDNLRAVLPFLSHVHVFHWKNYHERHTLKDGAGDWMRWIGMLKQHGFGGLYIMEFVKNDSEIQFGQDLEWLRRATNGT